MDIYEEIVELLGLKSKPNSIEEIERELLQELNKLNENFRSLQNQIRRSEESIEKLRQETAHHNQKAISEVKRGREDEARLHLRRKEDKLEQIQNKESSLRKTREHLQKIEEKREKLESKLQQIRNQKKY